MIQMIAGIIIIIIAIYFLVKKKESRMVLFVAGLAMCIVALKPMFAFEAFSDAIGKKSLFEPIISVMGYSMVMKVTKSDQHLIYLLTRYLKKAGSLLIFGVVIATFLINISLTSTSGISAAVGAIFISLLVSSGVHPAIAGAAILAGTYGSMLNPGYPMNVLTSEVSGISVVEVIANHTPAVIVSAIASGIVLTLIANLRKENKGYESALGDSLNDAIDENFKINYLQAVLPIFPLILIVASSMGLFGSIKIAISHSMIIGIFVTYLITRADPGTLTKEFFKGAGNAFASIFGIIVTASVFTAGMEAVGLIDALINLMISVPSIATISAAAGPFLLAVITGSGEAATTAFNTAVTVNASQFGILAQDMGSVAALAGAFGRAMSPLAGGAIILAGFGKVDSMEIAKRSAPGMITALIISTVLLLVL